MQMQGPEEPQLGEDTFTQPPDPGHLRIISNIDELGQQVRKEYYSTIELIYRTCNFSPRHVMDNAFTNRAPQPSTDMQPQPNNSMVPPPSTETPPQPSTQIITQPTTEPLPQPSTEPQQPNTQTITQPSIEPVPQASSEAVAQLDGPAQEQASDMVYLPEVMLVGSVHNMETSQIRDHTGQMVAVYKIIFRCSYDGRNRTLIIKKDDYRSLFIRLFNRMMRAQNEKYLFTHLQPVMLYHNDSVNPALGYWELYFVIQPTSQISQITERFYNLMLRPVERLVDQEFTYCRLPLTKIYSIDDLDRNFRDGFVFSAIKQRFESREKENYTLVGVSSIVRQPKFEKNSISRKNMELLVTQVMFRDYSMVPSLSSNGQAACREIGRCRVIVKYQVNDSEYIEGMFVNNCVYGFIDPEIVITDNVNIIFIVNIPRISLLSQYVFKLTEQPFEGIDFGSGSVFTSENNFRIREIEELFGIRLQTSKISSLLQKSINRNLVQLQVGLLGIDIVYGSIKCSRCGLQIKTNQHAQRSEPQPSSDDMRDEAEILEQQCMQTHAQAHALHLWGVLRVADNSGACLISMEHKEIMSFLELSDCYSELEAVVKANGRGMAIMTSNKQKNKQFDEDPLWKIKFRTKKRFMEKTVIGYAKAELGKTFREGLNEQEQLDYQASFHNSKKFIQSKKIFPNGVIEKKFQELLLLPYLKIIQVRPQDQ